MNRSMKILAPSYPTTSCHLWGTQSGWVNAPQVANSWTMPISAPAVVNKTANACKNPVRYSYHKKYWVQSVPKWSSQFGAARNVCHLHKTDPIRALPVLWSRLPFPRRREWQTRIPRRWSRIMTIICWLQLHRRLTLASHRRRLRFQRSRRHKSNNWPVIWVGAMQIQPLREKGFGINVPRCQNAVRTQWIGVELLSTTSDFQVVFET